MVPEAVVSVAVATAPEITVAWAEVLLPTVAAAEVAAPWAEEEVALPGEVLGATLEALGATPGAPETLPPATPGGKRLGRFPTAGLLAC